MFAGTDGGYSNLSFKATDIAFEALTGTGRARPAPYMARAKWVMFDDLAGLDAGEVRGWLRTSHELVAAKLTKAQRKALGLVA
jgi:predicted DNA-binding protein (MmcQ/YjbR family)